MTIEEMKRHSKKLQREMHKLSKRLVQVEAEWMALDRQIEDAEMAQWKAKRDVMTPAERDMADAKAIKALDKLRELLERDGK